MSGPLTFNFYTYSHFLAISTHRANKLNLGPFWGVTPAYATPQYSKVKTQIMTDFQHSFPIAYYRGGGVV